MWTAGVVHIPCRKQVTVQHMQKLQHHPHCCQPCQTLISPHAERNIQDALHMYHTRLYCWLGVVLIRRRSNARKEVCVCRAASVTAKSGVVCYTLARKSFDSLLGPIQDVWRFEALRKVPILFSLSNSQLFDLAQCMKYHTLQAGQIVFKKGEPGDLL